MILTIEDLDTAVDLGYEQIARLQLSIAKKSRMTGDITIYNKEHMYSLRLYASIDALVATPFKHTPEQDAVVKKLYNNIKNLTKDIRQWN